MRGLMILPVVAFLTAAAGEPAPRLTTDSMEYCGALAARFASLPPASMRPLRPLADDGIRLCQTGHVRTGVAKLRRAIRAAQLAD